MKKSTMAALALVALTGCGDGVGSDDSAHTALPPGAIRVATYNTSLNRPTHGGLLESLKQGDEQARASAAVIQRNRPDILLINEFDYDKEALQLFHDEYLGVGQHGEKPIEYGYRYAVPSNTGVPSGYDLDNDGNVGGGADAFGFGEHEGMFAFAILSRFPIDREGIRSFQKLRQIDMPGAVFPKKKNGTQWYTAAEKKVLRISSKNHVDVPIDVAGTTVHLLADHPTPPAFDGAEDRNGIRNFAEIRLWADYITPGKDGWIKDDNGQSGGLAEDELFVIVGDHNADPNDGSGKPGSMQQLLDNPRVDTSITPSSEGAKEAAELQGGENANHNGDPAHDTGDFGDDHLGNLRLDYALPSTGFQLMDAQVFWPLKSEPESEWITHSDHRMVFVDLQVY